MSKQRLVRASVLSSLLLILIAITALAAPEAPNTSKTTIKLNRKNVTIVWFEFIDPPPNNLTHEMCSAIPEGYTVFNDDLTSSRRKIGSVRELHNGHKVIKVQDLVRGTATDNFGNHYKWVYRNNVEINFDGSIAQVTMKDRFRVSGGPASHDLGFKFKWKYAADDIAIEQVYEDGELVDFYGDFIWPTDDGVTETSDPAFIPGSWKTIYNFGDWVNCDPI